MTTSAVEPEQKPAEEAVSVTKNILRLHGKLSYQSTMLGVTCLLMSVALLFANEQTISFIEQRAMEDKLASLRQVLPADLFDNNPLTDKEMVTDTEFSDKPVEVYKAKKNGVLTATAFQTSGKGYGGILTMIMAVDTKGKVLGVRVISHKETPGLADRIDITKDNWITSFNGLSLENTSEKNWHVKKDGGQFDQFTGATITPRAVVKAVYRGMQFNQRHFPTSSVAAGG